jgi:hypothetical protein
VLVRQSDQVPLLETVVALAGIDPPVQVRKLRITQAPDLKSSDSIPKSVLGDSFRKGNVFLGSQVDSMGWGRYTENQYRTVAMQFQFGFC